MLPFRIALRFLKTSPVQSGLIMGGIAIGIAVQIFVGSLITSLQANLIDTTIGSAPQITLQNPTAGDPITFSSRVEQVMSTDPAVKPGTIVPIRQANA
ncbi:hypothetical protein, partial [Salmonella enterica]|uniref:hypothetical protein n=1 Tax=Salmonella enterica TaxID=28901 RepID=UPI003524ADCA